jgi:ClpA/ClpB-like protein
MTLDGAILKEAKEARAALLDVQHQADKARLDYQYAIQRLHAAGGSLREIAEALGVSHQRVHQIVEDKTERESAQCPPFGVQFGPSFFRRRGFRGGGFLERFEPEARAVVAQAQEEGTELRHRWVGTEHLLLALARSEGPAGDALRSLGIGHDAVRAVIVERIGEGTHKVPAGPRPFTPRAKRAVEAALRAALGHGSERITPAHLAVALGECEGGAQDALIALGVDAAALRAALMPE